MNHEPVKDHAERKRLLALIERCEKEQTMSDDLIKREDVLNVLKLYGYLPLDSLYYTIEHDLPSADIDLSEYSDKLWRNAYERGKADRPQGEWIPCSKRLPEERGQYLVTTYAYNDYYYVDTLSFHKGKFYETDDEWGDMVDNDVVAWMPLPKPWKGADNEAD